MNNNMKKENKSCSNQSILVVDDEVDIRDSIRLVLEDEGYKVITAVDGEDCLRKLKSNSPDLILLDILMPGLTTKEIIEGIKKINSKLKIVFLTVVRLAEQTKRDIIVKNMKDYIEKPFNNKDLLKRVKKALKD